MITSRANERLQALRRLATHHGRAETGLFAVEGEDLVAAALAAGIVPVEAFLDGGRPAEELVAALQRAGTDCHEVEPAVLAGSSTLAHHPRCIAVVASDALPRLQPDAPAARVALRLHAVADPGNVGTVLRLTHALGPAHVALGPECADPLSPKALRASMGAIFSVPVVRLADSPPGRRIALEARSETPLWSADLSLPVAFELGAERRGLPDSIRAAADVVVSIPLEAGADSLNVAAAGALALYELRRRDR